MKNKQLWGILSGAFLIVAAVVGLNVLDTAFAAEYLKLPSKLCGPFPCPEGATGSEVAKNLAGRIVSNVRVIIGAIAILMIIVSGVKLVTASGNEEVFTEQTRNLTYSILGLFMVGLAGEIAQIFDVSSGGILDDPNRALQKSRLFNRTAEIVITFVKYIIGSVAVLFLVKSSLRMVLLGANDEEMTKDKKNIFYAILGLVVILFANPIINRVLFKVDKDKFPGIEAVRPGIDTKQLLLEIAGATNLITSIVGPLALLSLVAGGVMYLFAAGNDELLGRAKKIILWSIIGIVVIYGAFAIVSLFISRQFTGI